MALTQLQVTVGEAPQVSRGLQLAVQLAAGTVQEVLALVVPAPPGPVALIAQFSPPGPTGIIAVPEHGTGPLASVVPPQT